MPESILGKHFCVANSFHFSPFYIHKFSICSSGNSGPIWHQSWLWSIAFYCGEHFASLPYHNCVVVDFVVQCALNGIVDNQQHSIEIQREILQVISNAMAFPFQHF